MADIVIRGVNMPESCLECVLTHSFFRNLHCNQLEGMSGFAGPLPHAHDRHPDCPISPLPAGHGKIIDADAIWSNMTVEQSKAFQKGLAGTIELFEILEAATPIIPAEEQEDTECIGSEI